eukprot:803852-Rhodomonas_salina.1
MKRLRSKADEALRVAAGQTCMVRHSGIGSIRDGSNVIATIMRSTPARLAQMCWSCCERPTPTCPLASTAVSVCLQKNWPACKKFGLAHVCSLAAETRT